MIGGDRAVERLTPLSPQPGTAKDQGWGAP